MNNRPLMRQIYRSCSLSNDSPMQRYNKLIETGVLQMDNHQYKTIQILESLHHTLLSYSPPILPKPKVVKLQTMEQIGNDAGRDRIKSPDFAWIEDSQQSFYAKVCWVHV